MSRVLRMAVALAVVAVPALSGCSSGFDPATAKVRSDNAGGRAGDLVARAVVLVKSPDAVPAALAGTLINQGERNDVLERIEITESTAGADTITLEPDLTLRPHQLVALGTEGTDPITVPQAAGLRVGNFADVVLRFRDAGEIRLDVPIQARSGFYSEIVPTTPPRAEESPDPDSTAGPEAGSTADPTADDAAEGQGDGNAENAADRRAREAERNRAG